LGSVAPGRRGGRGAGVPAAWWEAYTIVTFEWLLFVALGFALGYYVVSHFMVSGGQPA